MKTRTLGLLILLAACGREPAEVAQPVTPIDAVAIPGDAPLVVFLGDSISAGLHLSEDEAFPAVVQRRLAGQGKPFRVVNAGVSGDTSGGGLSRIDWLLKQQPAVVVVELGGNDGLRGKPVSQVRENLDAILERVKASGAKALLLGMRIPTSLGVRYTEEFAEVYETLAEKHGTGFVPFFMGEIADRPEFFLADQIHPNAKGHAALAEVVGPALAKLL